MGSNHKINQIRGLLILIGGCIGLLFYLLCPYIFPYESERVIIEISITSSVFFIIVGVIFFIFAKKLPTLRSSPPLTILWCIAGTFALIVFFIYPRDLAPSFVLGIIFWALALPYIYLFLKKT